MTPTYSSVDSSYKRSEFYGLRIFIFSRPEFLMDFEFMETVFVSLEKTLKLNLYESPLR
jgi:hypothetical protein